MPRPAQRYDIFLPLRYSDGREIESEKFIQLQDELIEQFNGVTSVKRTLCKESGNTKARGIPMKLSLLPP